jgi:hypothetical protein
MTNRFRIVVTALSAAVIALGASALRAPEANATRICNNTTCNGADACSYSAGHYCSLTKIYGEGGGKPIAYLCSEGEC